MPTLVLFSGGLAHAAKLTGVGILFPHDVPLVLCHLCLLLVPQGAPALKVPLLVATAWLRGAWLRGTWFLVTCCRYCGFRAVTI